jgi:nitrite reductase/ring-hydroxylating ferredoxin subunit
MAPMTIKSKIIVFFLIISLQSFLVSCKKSKYDVIPSVVVDFTINLNDPLFFNLLSPFTFVYVDQTTNNWGQYSAGYDNNGIIVFRSTEDEFYAYDRTCPYDYEVNHKSVKINADMIYATCPNCGTTYALSANGTPVSGVGRYPLKNYRTGFNGLLVHVYYY